MLNLNTEKNKDRCNQMTMEVGNYLKPQLVKFYEGIKHVSALKLVTNINTSCKKKILCIFQLMQSEIIDI